MMIPLAAYQAFPVRGRIRISVADGVTQHERVAVLFRIRHGSDE